MNLLKLKIVTPESKVFEEDDFTSITLPTSTGQITVLPGHIPLVSKIVHGEIIARKSGKEESLVTTEGFMKLNDAGEILILADYAVRSGDLELAKIQEAKRKAEEAMREKKSEKEFAIAESELRRTLLELKVAQKRKTKIPGI